MADLYEEFDWGAHGRVCKDAYQPDPDHWTCPHIDEHYAATMKRVMKRWGQPEVQYPHMIETVHSACPNCGDVAFRQTYDIGSGPELSCASCEWCWGAMGQDLKPLDTKAIMDEARKMGYPSG